MSYLFVILLGHGFVNGNKRAAVEVFEVIEERNAVDGPPRELVWKVVGQCFHWRVKVN